ncbi:MAG: SDR family NAD(P)-dependent oxidoreductase, partial [Proteobacteria bacterium]|nr:SDR family NAD(P)-dependent oxidoreductase [Pseudomonadota bacterium]
MLQGKTALITGGSSGIGLATARLLREHGARVAITGSSRDKLGIAAAKLGEGVLTIQGNVASLDDLWQLREELAREFGALDVLFANAGVAFATPIDTTDEASYHTMMDVNVKGVFSTIQSVLPLMSKGGSIILNTSWLNQVGTSGRALLSAS